MRGAAAAVQQALFFCVGVDLQKMDGSSVSASTPPPSTQEIDSCNSSLTILLGACGIFIVMMCAGYSRKLHRDRSTASSGTVGNEIEVVAILLTPAFRDTYSYDFFHSSLWALRNFLHPIVCIKYQPFCTSDGLTHVSIQIIEEKSQTTLAKCISTVLPK